MNDELREAAEELAELVEQLGRDYTPFISAFEAGDPWSADGEVLGAALAQSAARVRAALQESE